MDARVAPQVQLQLTGGFPNVYFNSNAGTLSDVKHARFIPLPLLGDVSIPDRASYRYIRETDELWSTLHRGRLTSSRLAAAMGFYEPRAAKILGLPRVYTSHSKMISVYHHLREKVSDAYDSNIQSSVAHDLNIHAHLVSYDKHMRDDARDDSLLESVKIRTSRYLHNQRDVQKVRMAWGSAQEAATISLLCQRLPGAPFFLMEVGLMSLDVASLCDTWGFRVDDLPPIGATPDGLLVDTCTDAASAAHGFAQKHLDGARFKVVEVKNVCPFSSRRNGKKGFELRDRGPRNSLDPLYVPQLQFHMLCSGVDTALLASRSATKGTNVFQMQRDDEYIRAMLEVIRCFYTTYVKKSKVPPQNAFSHMRLHSQLLLKTRELAYSCPLYCHIDQTHEQDIDMRTFLDSIHSTTNP